MNRLALFLFAALIAFHPEAAKAQVPSYTWTNLVPAKDTRDPDVRYFDDDLSEKSVIGMNETEKVFQHRLTWRQLPISKLLSASAPFCELDFDPMQPMPLSTKEKSILREYLQRGGFLFLSEDAFPYTPAQLAGLKKWTMVDFMTKELPAADPNFTFERITEKHPMYSQYYKTVVPPPETWALQAIPDIPDLILVSYKGHPCAFFYANAVSGDDDKWETLTRPFSHDFFLIPEDYALYVNLYVYASMH